MSYFNPRSPHGERRSQSQASYAASQISTHAPRTGSDWTKAVVDAFVDISTHAPRTGSDAIDAVYCHIGKISTHAPRTGSDASASAPAYTKIVFQPTLPARGATWTRWAAYSTAGNFNPRSPHGERRTRWIPCPATAYFNPRSPHGERPYIDEHDALWEKFQPTLPARGATLCLAG